MKIQTREACGRTFKQTIESYVERSLVKNSQYREGHIERIADEVESQSRAFGKLIELMAQKGLITAPEITGLFDTFPNDDAKFI